MLKFPKETKKDLRIEHRGALWTKGRVAAALAPKDGRYYEAALDVYGPSAIARYGKHDEPTDALR